MAINGVLIAVVVGIIYVDPQRLSNEHGIIGTGYNSNAFSLFRLEVSLTIYCW